MQKHSTTLKAVHLNAKATLAGLAVVMVMLGFTRTECPVGEFFGAALRVALDALPSLVLAAWQALQACGYDHSRALEGLLSGGCWPVILSIAAAV